MSYTFLLASTTNYGVILAESLLKAGFFCHGVLTPTAQPAGRKKIITKNPVQIWAEAQNLPIFFVEKKLDQALIASLPKIDFLLVADFGYYVPEKLTNLAKYLAVNVHPSALPKYRGSSPGQAVILNGEKNSAVSLIQVAKEMDAGDLLAQIPFQVNQNWNKDQYYDFAFSLAAQSLPQKLLDFAEGKIKLTPQKGEPTFALKLDRAAGFIKNIQAEPMLTYRKFLAYHPWPGIWTLDENGKRVKILACHLDQKKELAIDLIQIEGKTAKKP
ncbi:MAG: formyltransferase family protein [bacterium]|nr:formyltransferase family protein [bacterium]